MSKRKLVSKRLTVIIEASDEATAEAMLDQLCRTACDIANSTVDQRAKVIVADQVKA